MTSSLRPSSFFTNNPVSRAERTYQQRSTKQPRPWRRWVNRTVKWLMITLALILFGGLFLASVLLRDPTPIVDKLNPLPNLLGILVSMYHLLLMFQTISLTANSISREKEAQTWDMLVLTGIDARQIVRGKWWAAVQHQLPKYLLLGLLRIGATASVAIGASSSLYLAFNNYDRHILLPHPASLILTAVIIMAFTLANLAFSAACGVMASAASRRSVIAIARGFGNQILLSLITAIGLVYLFTRVYNSAFYSVYSVIAAGAGSLIDNGVVLTTTAIYVDYFSSYYAPQASDSPYTPISWEWIAGAVIAMLLYGLLIWFALWQAEKSAIAAMATPVNA